jgi:hypothetical protein
MQRDRIGSSGKTYTISCYFLDAPSRDFVPLDPAPMWSGQTEIDRDDVIHPEHKVDHAVRCA